MATPLTDGINALTQYANETTGKSDTTLSDAVGSLVDGYGGGIIKSESIGSYTVDVSWENDTDGNPIKIFNAVSSALGIDANDLAPTQAFILVFRNNTAKWNYKADYIYRTKDNNYGCYCLRNNKSVLRGYNSSTSTWASAGTVIDVYKLTYNLP